MAFSFAPWVNGTVSGVARFEAACSAEMPPVPAQFPPANPPPDAAFLRAVDEAFAAVFEHYSVPQTRIVWNIQRFPPGLLPVAGDSIYGAALLVFAKAVAEFYPDRCDRAIRGLCIDRIGITATPGTDHCFANVGLSTQEKLKALAVLRPVRIAVVPRGQKDLPPANGRMIHVFKEPLDLELPWIQCHDPWECIRDLYLLQVRSILA